MGGIVYFSFAVTACEREIGSIQGVIFIDEHNGFLALTDEEHDAAKVLNPHIHKYAREFLEYGESKEGTGPGTNSLHKCIEQSRLPRLNIQRRMDGVTCGYLTIVAAMPPWLMMLLMSAK